MPHSPPLNTRIPQKSRQTNARPKREESNRTALHKKVGIYETVPKGEEGQGAQKRIDSRESRGACAAGRSCTQARRKRRDPTQVDAVRRTRRGRPLRREASVRKCLGVAYAYSLLSRLGRFFAGFRSQQSFLRGETSSRRKVFGAIGAACVREAVKRPHSPIRRRERKRPSSHQGFRYGKDRLRAKASDRDRKEPPKGGS